MRICNDVMTSLRARSWVMVFAFACTPAACLGGDQRHETAGIKIGALLPYTGELAASGPALEQGMTMAAETVNRAGGVAGQSLVLEIEDTHSSLERGVASAERLFAQGVAGLVGPEEVVLASELAPTLNTNQALMISGGISARAEPGKEPSLWLRIYPSAKTVTARLASRMIDDGVTETSLLMLSDGYGSTFATFFSLKSTALGGKILDSITLPDDGSAVSFAKGLPASLVLLAYPRAGARPCNRSRQPGFRGRWYLGPTLESEEFLLNTPPGVLDGMVGITGPSDASVADQFRARFGQDPSLGQTSISTAWRCRRRCRARTRRCNAA